MQGQRATATIRAVKQRFYDAELHCDVLTSRGFRAECRCGWHSSVLTTITAARYALKQHRQAGHVDKSVESVGSA